MKSIIIIIDYFGGQWPEWFPLFLESCRRNPTITWLFHTDCPIELFKIDNVIFRQMSREEYIDKVSLVLGIKFAPANNYKLCDLKPMRGEIHKKEIRGYDFFGYGDIDVIYGDIRKFYTDEVLENNVISTHPRFVCGHFALIRNKRWLRRAFRRVHDWRWHMEDGVHHQFDESFFNRAFEYPVDLSNREKFFYDLRHPFSRKFRGQLYWREQYTTPFTPICWKDGTFNHPTVWFWKDGHITDRPQGGNEYIYFHFMNFKYARYIDRDFGNQAFWSNLDSLVHVRPEEISRGFIIDRYGFHPWR